MLKALKVPPDFLSEETESPKALDRLVVGPNDIFVVDVDVTSCAKDRVHKYLTQIKESLEPVFEKVGLTGRIMVAAGDNNGFRVIEVQEGPPPTGVGFKYPMKGSITASCLKERKPLPVPKKSRPPVMG